MTTLYSLLGVEADATPEAIKQAWREMARRHHPDVNPAPDAERIMQLVNAAYEILSDPQKRAAYDALLKAGSAPAPDQFDPNDPMSVIRQAQRAGQRSRKAKEPEPPPPFYKRAAFIAPTLLIVASAIAFLVWRSFVHSVQPAPRLSLEYRLMNRWPDGLDSSDVVVHLTLKGNNITEIPDRAATLRSLVYFDISSNELVSVSPKLWTLRALQVVDLSDNRIETLSVPQDSKSMLGVLRLANNPLKDDALRELARFEYLQELDLRGTPVSEAAVAAFKKERPAVQVMR